MITGALVVRRTAFLLALVVVLALMLRPVQEVSSSNDKIDHVAVFVALTVLGAWSQVQLRWLVPGLITYGAVTEVLQAQVTSDRHGDPMDLVADAAGVLATALIVLAFRRVRAASSGPGRPHG